MKIKISRNNGILIRNQYNRKEDTQKMNKEENKFLKRSIKLMSSYTDQEMAGNK